MMKEENDSKRFVFTEKRVRDIEPAQKDKQRYYDTKMPGLCLVVTPKGKKTYVVYKKINGSAKTITIGTSPSITADAARSLAQEIMVQLARGENPVDNEKFETWSLERWLNRYAKVRQIKAETENQYRNAFKNYSPDLYRKPLTKISSDIIVSIYKKISEGKLSWVQEDGTVYTMRKGSSSQANLWARGLRAVFNFATVDTQLSLKVVNPLAILSSHKIWIKDERKKTRIRDCHLHLLIEAIESVLVDSLVSGLESRAAFCDRLLFLLFTGLRKVEAQNLTWDRVQLRDRYFWIKETETKNREKIELPITDTLREIFVRRKNLSGDNPYVFGVLNGSNPVKDARKTILEILDQLEMLEKKRAGELGDMNPDVYKCFSEQTLRRTYASVAFTLGNSLYTIKRLLNHKVSDSQDVTLGYLAASADELRATTNKIENFILYQAIGSQNDTYPVELWKDI